MELYLDTVKIEEVRAASSLGVVDGVTTTPTFMYREGISNPDRVILEISSMVKVLQIEALGKKKEEIISEVLRQEKMGLKRDRTVYKIPISNAGIASCRELSDDGFQINLHLVHTIQQAFLAMKAGATYVCPLVGRMQDQGWNAVDIVKSFIEMKTKYNFTSKVMFSSVRNAEHVRNALECGVDTCTIPWKIIEKLSENNLTEIYTEQFFADHRATQITL